MPIALVLARRAPLSARRCAAALACAILAGCTAQAAGEEQTRQGRSDLAASAALAPATATAPEVGSGAPGAAGTLGPTDQDLASALAVLSGEKEADSSVLSSRGHNPDPAPAKPRRTRPPATTTTTTQPGPQPPELPFTLWYDTIGPVYLVAPGGTRSLYGNTGRAAPPARFPSVWDDLAFCESSGNWHINTGNGFYGGLQFVHQTWVSYGGLAYAERADLATRDQQIDIAKRVLARSGWGAWPACTKKLGLR